MAAHKLNRIVFLCSGNGGNLAFIQHAIKKNWLVDTQIVAVLTDRKCNANTFCDKNGIYNLIVDFNINSQQNLLKELEAFEPDIIITTVHKILGYDVVDKYRDKLINLHYSLLPAFSGLIGIAAIKAALEYSVLYCGVTAHLVNEKVDAGKPIIQGVITLDEGETLEKLVPVVFRTGCIALLLAINKLTSPLIHGKSKFEVKILGHHCSFNGYSSYLPPDLHDAVTWNAIQRSIN